MNVLEFPDPDHHDQVRQKLVEGFLLFSLDLLLEQSRWFKNTDNPVDQFQWSKLCRHSAFVYQVMGISQVTTWNFDDLFRPPVFRSIFFYFL